MSTCSIGLELYVPGAHWIQIPSPLLVHPRLQVQPRKFPGGRVFAGHCIQVIPSISNDSPASQLQLISAVLATGDRVFCGHSIQPEFPISDLYVPPKHCEHVLPFAPVNPALH